MLKRLPIHPVYSSCLKFDGDLRLGILIKAIFSTRSITKPQLERPPQITEIKTLETVKVAGYYQHHAACVSATFN